MIIDIATKDDLLKLKQEIIEELLKIPKSPDRQTWMRSKEVMKMLKISAGTLQNLRQTGKLPFRKVNGTIFYSQDMVEWMIENG